MFFYVFVIGAILTGFGLKKYGRWFYNRWTRLINRRIKDRPVTPPLPLDDESQSDQLDTAITQQHTVMIMIMGFIWF